MPHLTLNSRKFIIQFLPAFPIGVLFQITVSWLYIYIYIQHIYEIHSIYICTVACLDNLIIYIYVIISCYNRLYPHDISILFSLGHSVTSNCNSTESFGAWHGLIRSFDNAVRRILLFWKRVPIIVCVAYPIVNEFGWPEQALLSRTSNSMFTNIDGFSAIWLIIWYETCLRGSEVGARKMCPANLARLSSSSCGKGDTFLVGWLGNAVWTFMYYLTVDYLIPFHIQKNNEITKKEVQRGF